MSERSESKRLGAKQHKNSGRNTHKGDATWRNFTVDFKEYPKGITVNKNGVPNDTRGFIETSGVRIGVAAETTRGYDEAWFKTLAETILQPIRNHYGIPFSVSSGFRSHELSQAIGSSSKSQHGCNNPGEAAADFEVPGISNMDLCYYIKSVLNFDQLITL